MGLPENSVYLGPWFSTGGDFAHLGGDVAVSGDIVGCHSLEG